MITKEIFKKFIICWNEFDANISNIENALFPDIRVFTSLKETDWFDCVGHMFDMFIETNFTQEGQDCITEYLFGRLDGQQILTIIYPKDIFGEERKLVITNLDDLWSYLESNNYIING